jgi:uncharacterized protein YjbI with pentapeptide repeats
MTSFQSYLKLILRSAILLSIAFLASCSINNSNTLLFDNRINSSDNTVRDEYNPAHSSLDNRVKAECKSIKKNRRGLNYSGSHLSAHDFSNQDLQGADFRDADLRGADFQCSDVSGANFDGADLSGASFENAKTDGASLQKAALSGSNL